MGKKNVSIPKDGGMVASSLRHIVAGGEQGGEHDEEGTASDEDRPAPARLFIEHGAADGEDREGGEQVAPQTLEVAAADEGDPMIAKL